MKFIKLTLTHNGFRPCKETIYVNQTTIILIKPFGNISYLTLSTRDTPVEVGETTDEIFKLIEGK